MTITFKIQSYKFQNLDKIRHISNIILCLWIKCNSKYSPTLSQSVLLMVNFYIIFTVYNYNIDDYNAFNL